MDEEMPPGDSLTAEEVEMESALVVDEPVDDLELPPASPLALGEDGGNGAEPHPEVEMNDEQAELHPGFSEPPLVLSSSTGEQTSVLGRSALEPVKFASTLPFTSAVVSPATASATSTGTSSPFSSTRPSTVTSTATAPPPPQLASADGDGQSFVTESENVIAAQHQSTPDHSQHQDQSIENRGANGIVVHQRQTQSESPASLSLDSREKEQAIQENTITIRQKSPLVEGERDRIEVEMDQKNVQDGDRHVSWTNGASGDHDDEGVRQINHVEIYKSVHSQADLDKSGLDGIYPPSPATVLLTHSSNQLTYRLFTASTESTSESQLFAEEKDQHLYEGPLTDVFAAMREQLDLPHSEELTFHFEALGISLSEDNVATATVSLYDFDRIHIGCSLPGGLHVVLESETGKPRFRTGFEALVEHVAKSWDDRADPEDDYSETEIGDQEGQLAVEEEGDEDYGEEDAAHGNDAETAESADVTSGEVEALPSSAIVDATPSSPKLSSGLEAAHELSTTIAESAVPLDAAASHLASNLSLPPSAVTQAEPTSSDAQFALSATTTADEAADPFASSVDAPLDDESLQEPGDGEGSEPFPDMGMEGEEPSFYEDAEAEYDAARDGDEEEGYDVVETAEDGDPEDYVDPAGDFAEEQPAEGEPDEVEYVGREEEEIDYSLGDDEGEDGVVVTALQGTEVLEKGDLVSSASEFHDEGGEGEDVYVDAEFRAEDEQDEYDDRERQGEEDATILPQPEVEKEAQDPIPAAETGEGGQEDTIEEGGSKDVAFEEMKNDVGADESASAGENLAPQADEVLIDYDEVVDPSRPSTPAPPLSTTTIASTAAKRTHEMEEGVKQEGDGLSGESKRPRLSEESEPVKAGES